MGFTRYYDQDILTPAGTAIATPLATVPALETNHLDAIEVDVPDGHARLTGIRVIANGTVVVPFSLNGWIVANAHYFSIPFDDDIDANDLTVQTYNTDVYDHTFYVRFVMSNTVAPVTANIVSAQLPGVVASGAEAAVGALAVTADTLAVAAPEMPPGVPLAVPQAPAEGAPQ